MVVFTLTMGAFRLIHSFIFSSRAHRSLLICHESAHLKKSWIFSLRDTEVKWEITPSGPRMEDWVWALFGLGSRPRPRRPDQSRPPASRSRQSSRLDENTGLPGRDLRESTPLIVWRIWQANASEGAKWRFRTSDASRSEQNHPRSVPL